MKVSVSMVVTDQSIDVADLAHALEDRGFAGLWLPEHTHIPVSRATPYPLGGDLPLRYQRMIDPLVGLAVAAAVTKTIRLGTGVLLVAQRDPIVTAKALASIDHYAGGRLTVGIGYGWNTEEMEDHGVDPASRRRRAHEHILAMRSLWEHDIAAFSGEFVRLEPSWSWPKPRQRRLPILIGAPPGPATVSAITRYGSGWIGVGRSVVERSLPNLLAQLEAAGRNTSQMDMVCMCGPVEDPNSFARLEDAGATEICVDVAPEERDIVLSRLDDLAALVTH